MLISPFKIIYNNVSYGNSQYGIRVEGSGAASVENNLIKNNISISNTLQELQCVNGGENNGSNGSGNVYTYNCFGVESSNFIE